MIPSALLLTLALGAPTLDVRVSAQPGTTFSALAPSTVTVNVGGRDHVRPLRGVPDPSTPDAYTRLLPARLTLPAGTRGPATVRLRLFLCDKARGLCTVQEQTRRVLLTPGRALVVAFNAAPQGWQP
ncbi:hypothetical protein [Deinococcus arcticus]|uniref:Thiol:disulfide interchange protein DsbD N-terminal domain-containing protein n=1 Tax=Deinococcus arcticus TaxID=2136176 RepID=A0A2T3WAV0_9DEIO|nr:hypothetical protein [Deinococcus arcticus]PTA68967.1 hypothetical protein C8263_03970 [Deinococcus arcticus]